MGVLASFESLNNTDLSVLTDKLASLTDRIKALEDKYEEIEKSVSASTSAVDNYSAVTIKSVASYVASLIRDVDIIENKIDRLEEEIAHPSTTDESTGKTIDLEDFYKEFVKLRNQYLDDVSEAEQDLKDKVDPLTGNRTKGIGSLQSFYDEFTALKNQYFDDKKSIESETSKIQKNLDKLKTGKSEDFMATTITIFDELQALFDQLESAKKSAT